MTQNEPLPTCWVCKRSDGPGERRLRPYGANGADICYGCDMEDWRRGVRFGLMVATIGYGAMGLAYWWFQ